MLAPFKLDAQVSIERRTTVTDAVYGRPVETSWVLVADHIWANVQDVLPKHAESTTNGLRVGSLRTRLLIRNNPLIDATMRVTLHSAGDRQMQIILGPSLLDDRRHTEFLLESYST